MLKTDCLTSIKNIVITLNYLYKSKKYFVHKLIIYLGVR